MTVTEDAGPAPQLTAPLRELASELRDRLSAELNRFRGAAPMGDDQAFLMLTEEGELLGEVHLVHDGPLGA